MLILITTKAQLARPHHSKSGDCREKHFLFNFYDVRPKVFVAFFSHKHCRTGDVPPVELYVRIRWKVDVLIVKEKIDVE